MCMVSTAHPLCASPGKGILTYHNHNTWFRFRHINSLCIVFTLHWVQSRYILFVMFHVYLILHKANYVQTRNIFPVLYKQWGSFWVINWNIILVSNTFLLRFHTPSKRYPRDHNWEKLIGDVMVLSQLLAMLHMIQDVDVVDHILIIHILTYTTLIEPTGEQAHCKIKNNLSVQ